MLDSSPKILYDKAISVAGYSKDTIFTSLDIVTSDELELFSQLSRPVKGTLELFDVKHFPSHTRLAVRILGLVSKEVSAGESIGLQVAPPLTLNFSFHRSGGGGTTGPGGASASTIVSSESGSPP